MIVGLAPSLCVDFDRELFACRGLDQVPDRNLDPELDHIYCQQTPTSDLSCSYVYTPGEGEEADEAQLAP